MIRLKVDLVFKGSVRTWTWVCSLRKKSDIEKCLTDTCDDMNSSLLVEYTRKGNLTVKSVYYSSHSLIGPFPNSSHAYAQPVSMVRYSRWKTLQECKDYFRKRKKCQKKEKDHWLKQFGNRLKIMGKWSKILEFKLIT